LVTSKVASSSVSTARKTVAETVVIDGNKAAAYGAMLSRAQVVAAYPITPQSPVVENLSTFVADGLLDADFVDVESEHSALSVLHGAALAGARTFTATSGQGLCFMFEPYVRTSSMRLPIVMCIATRETLTPQSIWGGHQDAFLVREAGWIQMFAENNQEILDSVIMAYKIAENPDVALPVNVCFDGFYLSHMAERVDLPPQELVDSFLPPPRVLHSTLDPDHVMAVDPLTPGDLLVQYRHMHVQAMQRAKKVIVDVHKEFAELFGRSYGGLIEEYRMDGAEMAIVANGAPVGTAREAVDIARANGKKIGLVKLKTMRPFPRQELCAVLGNLKAVGVMDKNVCYGWASGAILMEVRSALKDVKNSPPVVGFIDGLGGADITLEDYDRAIGIIEEAAKGDVENEVTWLALEEE